uniref:Uncharacterized protein n=1 Tax=viral metagenome TaxID=1070528 RepID=A0A6H2A2C7_9ZZZZ
MSELLLTPEERTKIRRKVDPYGDVSGSYDALDNIMEAIAKAQLKEVIDLLIKLGYQRAVEDIELYYGQALQEACGD